jgi:hypothetical protein
MIGRVHNLLMDVEEENDRLERELASPSPARLTEYAIARGAATSRCAGSAESSSASISAR